MMFTPFVLALALLTGAVGFASSVQAGQSVSLLNVSYDPTRELYTAVNAAFAKQWEAKTGQRVKIEEPKKAKGKESQ